MQLYRIEVGRDDGVEVRHIVGAIANEGDISSRYIGNIKLFASHSTIELPKGMPGEVLQHFTRTRILNKPMNMQLLGDAQPHTGGERRGGGRGFGGERREGGRNFSGERREGGVVMGVVLAANVVKAAHRVVMTLPVVVVSVVMRNHR